MGTYHPIGKKFRSRSEMKFTRKYFIKMYNLSEGNFEIN